jgi:fluoride exporter
MGMGFPDNRLFRLMTPTNAAVIRAAIRNPSGNKGVGMTSHQAFTFLLVFIGGGIGSMLRHAANQVGAFLFGVNLPSGTLFVNIIGSLAMGLIAGWFAFRGQGDQSMRLFLTTGIVGGFTTFSAFSLDTVLLWERGETVTAALYVAVSVAASILGVFVGLGIMRTAFP